MKPGLIAMYSTPEHEPEIPRIPATVPVHLHRLEDGHAESKRHAAFLVSPVTACTLPRIHHGILSASGEATLVLVGVNAPTPK
jgi:hypothetical protein